MDSCGCEHYRSPLDLVRIRFACCNSYYPCYLCHEALSDHPPKRWEVCQFHTLAILCCKCKSEMSIWDYLFCNARCPFCSAHFNPRCQLHWHLYFSEPLPAFESVRHPFQKRA